MDLLEELGVADEDRNIFHAVEEHLSYAAAAEALSLTEGRLKHRFFKTCRELERKPKGQPVVNRLMVQLAAMRQRPKVPAL